VEFRRAGVTFAREIVCERAGSSNGFWFERDRSKEISFEMLLSTARAILNLRGMVQNGY